MVGLKDNGRYTGYACVDRDITNLKRFEGVLRELISFRESIIDSANVLIDVLDEENNVLVWNKGAERITGYKREEVIGSPHIWDQLYPDPGYRDEIYELSLNISSQGQTVENFETTIQTKTKEQKVISWHAHEITDDTDKSVGLIGIGRDITRQKQAEESLQILQKSLKLEKKKLEQVLDLSHRLSAILDLEQLIKMIPAEATRLLDAKRCSMMVLNPTKNVLQIAGAAGLPADVIDNARVKLGEPVCGYVAQKGEPVLVQDIETDPRFNQQKRTWYEGSSFISVPIELHEKIVGVINVSDKVKHPQEVFTGIDMKILTMIVRQAAISIENAFYYKEMKQLSITDSLTGLFNHRYFRTRIQEEIERSNRYQHALSVLMMDIDNFKNYNDTYGHPKGDELIKEISLKLSQVLRDSDTACRYGGDEFVVILPETDVDQANNAALKIQKAVNSIESEVEITLSIGIASHTIGTDGTHLVAKADRALYQVKRSGKNDIGSHQQD